MVEGRELEGVVVSECLGCGGLVLGVGGEGGLGIGGIGMRWRCGLWIR